MKVGDKVVIKATGHQGKIIGQIKGLWLIEMCNGRTSMLRTNKLTKLI